MNVPISGAAAVDQLLSALGDRLQLRGVRYEVVVVGGSALLALGLVDRPTRDVDLVALRVDDVLTSVVPLPAELVDARDRVARDLELPEDWLNAGPASLMDLGMPVGFLQRVETRSYGPALSVSFASRVDQIHFKLYATVDQGPGKHERDLRALGPTRQELLQAARWSRTHDPSEGYLHVLRLVLKAFGVDDADI